MKACNFDTNKFSGGLDIGIIKNYLSKDNISLTTKTRAIIQSYNTRIATHLADHLGLPDDVILKHINNMSENKREKEIE